MAETSKIEWTDGTANFWWGCMKVSPGCSACYAEVFSKRVGRNIWGPEKTSDRWRTKAIWKDILKWDKQAENKGKRKRVFVQSMSDFFENHYQLVEWRAEAVGILENLKWIDVQLLTKRPENVAAMVPQWMDKWPPHIWMGVSAEDQQRADERVPELMNIPAAVRFLSAEPLLGPIDLWGARYPDPGGGYSGAISSWRKNGIDWVIVGGESGPHARPMSPRWARDLRDQCEAASVAYFFKQWAEWAWVGDPVPDKLFSGGAYLNVPTSETTSVMTAVSGWQRANTANQTILGEYYMAKVGKHVAGRLLDGVEHNALPERVNYAIAKG